MQISDLQLIGSELAIRWDDGQETYIPLEKFRRHCPCATCAGESDLLGNTIRPSVTLTEGSFTLRSWNFVGSYALQPIWADGHSTGLYSHPLLRTLGEPA